MVSNTISSLLGVAIVIVAANSCDSLLRLECLAYFQRPPSATKYRLVSLIKKKYSFCFLKSMYSFHRWITRRRRSCSSFTAYLCAHKKIKDCTGAEEAGVELTNKVDMISYTGKTGWEMPYQLWSIKTLPWLCQTKQDTTRWLPERCTANTTWQKKRRRH